MSTPEALASPPVSTPWVPLWPLAPSTLGELAYAEKTTDTAITATSAATGQTVVTAPAVTLDGQTPVIIEFYSRGVQVPAGSSAWAALTLWEDGVIVDDLSFLQNHGVAGTGITVPARLARRLTPSAGAHTYSIRAYGSASGGLVRGTAGAPAFIRILLAAATAAPVSNPTYGTSFPASPANGQEHILVDSVTNPSYQWRFRYNASSSSPYKWEFVGGADLIDGPRGNLASFTSTGYQLFTGGPGVTLPRAGEYLFSWGLFLQSLTSGAFDMMAAPGRIDGAQYGTDTSYVTTSTFAGGTVGNSEKRTVAAGDVIALFVRLSTTGDATTRSGWIRATPIRVS